MKTRHDRVRRRKKPDLLHVWERLVGELGGEIEVDRKNKPKRIDIPHGPWTVVVDIYTVQAGEGSSTYTRIRALFRRAAPFSLRVTRRNPFHALAGLFGWRSVHIGYGRVDRTLFVRSDRPELARSALRGTSLGQALLTNPRLKLVVTRPGKRIRKVSGDTVGEVQLLKSGIERDVARLRALVQIVTVALDELRRLHVAEPEPVEDVSI